MFGPAPLSGQVFVDSRSRGIGITRQQVPGHETDRVITGVFPRLETVNTFDDVLTTKIRIVSCNPFALDNCMRIVFAEFLANVLKKDGDVCSSVRRRDGST